MCYEAAEEGKATRLRSRSLYAPEVIHGEL